MVVILILLAIFITVGMGVSVKLVVQNYTIYYPNLPVNFDGYKIVQLTDLHGRVFGSRQDELISLVSQQQPDIIVLTGDLIDSSDLTYDPAKDLCNGLLGVAPVYWVKGNHFYSADQTLTTLMQSDLTAMGVKLLSCSSDILTVEGQSIRIDGMDDPYSVFNTRNMPEEYDKKVVESIIARKVKDMNTGNQYDCPFRMLLTHRPTAAEIYAQYGYSLVFAGHTHGGQICLPFGIEIVGEGGIFPKYNSGYNDINGMPLIISSGLGYSTVNVRLYNPPEVVVVTLKVKE